MHRAALTAAKLCFLCGVSPCWSFRPSDNDPVLASSTKLPRVCLRTHTGPASAPAAFRCAGRANRRRFVMGNPSARETGRLRRLLGETELEGLFPALHLFERRGRRHTCPVVGNPHAARARVQCTLWNAFVRLVRASREHSLFKEAVRYPPRVVVPLLLPTGAEEGTTGEFYVLLRRELD
ncbi:hypothetical protein HPB50_009764 [Hyalomma asiaticum]|uniref:Uncharacterized protein n=1 Tax=Hyalomma asiaticum TaxID=266040 RepID=A0ACB7S065_HYAAI|nr:hypothetical protein HPB50_009764 [Hyalomma asiaticum]